MRRQAASAEPPRASGERKGGWRTRAVGLLVVLPQPDALGQPEVRADEAASALRACKRSSSCWCCCWWCCLCWRCPLVRCVRRTEERLGEQEVLGLEVAVHDVAAVHVRHRAQHLLDHVHGARLAQQVPLRRDRLAQVAAPAQLHHQVHVLLVLEHVVQPREACAWCRTPAMDIRQQRKQASKQVGE
eukprot:scaffold5330_cov350-Prasinococcus_capsulatus_cf.AAC.1